MRTLSRRELNRALLARQGLLRRLDAPLPEALERVGLVQAQYAPSMYFGLWSRVAGFGFAALTEALERREVIQGTLLRSTIHLASRGDYWPVALAIRQARRASYLRAVKDLEPERMEAAATALRRALAEGPLPRREVEALIGRPATRAIHLWVDLVRVPPSGTWERRRADLWADAERWLGPPPDTAPDGVALLVRRYLGGFGPAAPREIADWAGLRVGDVAPVLARMDLQRFRCADGTERLDLPGAPLPDGDTPAPVRLLGTWDATLLVHARRTGVLPEEHRPRIFHTRAPQSFPVFLVDGAVAGTWRLDGDGRFAHEAFERLDAAARRALEAEGAALSAAAP